MPSAALTSHIDVAQVVLYAFWLFFAGLIWYLRREDRREGYPLESDVPGQGRRGGNFNFLWIPPPKTFVLPHGGTVQVPSEERHDTREIKAQRAAPWPGAPLVPTGDPMLDGVGPAAYALREDAPELTLDGLPNIVPMRLVAGSSVAPGDSDPHGMKVVGADNRVAGTVTDLWIDRAEPQIRYLEVGLAGAEPARTVLLPISYARIDGYRREVRVRAILAHQFANVPALRGAEQVTKLEEEKITAYYAGGFLYATPDRAEPLL